MAELKQDPANANKGTPRGAAMLDYSLREFGAARSVVADKNLVVIGGNKTQGAAEKVGIGDAVFVHTTGDRLVVVVRDDLDLATDVRAKELAVADNRISEANLVWDIEQLRAYETEGVPLTNALWADDEFRALVGARDPEDGGSVTVPGPKLNDLFGVPPFSVLDARQGYWQDRKRAWIGLGIKSETGRGEGLAFHTEPEFYEAKRRTEKALGRTMPSDEFRRDYYRPPDTPVHSNTSVFDPVLCEIVYRWFSAPGAVVLDPFAGGSVRGVVAALLGRRYVGIDLRPEQVRANEEQWAAIKAAKETPDPWWIVGDSRIAMAEGGDRHDLVFTCPPYFDLETYSDDPADLSNMKWGEFLIAYRTIIRLAADRLAADRFFVIVVGEVRDPDGIYRSFVPETIAACESSGLRFYNDITLLTVCGSAAFRAKKQFSTTRKVVKTHQNVLVFVKGDPRRATEAAGVATGWTDIVPAEWEEEVDGTA